MTTRDAQFEADEFFQRSFLALTGHTAMRWQQRLFRAHFLPGSMPDAVSIPTGLGKTAVMAVWLIGLAWQMRSNASCMLPRRLVYVVDRRAVVDQSTTFAETLRAALEKREGAELRSALGFGEGQTLPISTLRGQFVDNRDWLRDPSRPAIIIGTVDMIGSRLLFEGYGASRKMRPYYAGLLGADALVLLDESHLVPPFEALLAEIAGCPDRYGPHKSAPEGLVPQFKLLPLSATSRSSKTATFKLEERDFLSPQDPIVIQRLFAKKRMRLVPLGDGELAIELATRAWKLAEAGKNPVRCLVYCNSRRVAESVKAELDTRAEPPSAKNAKRMRQNDASASDEQALADTELFVGARRVRERVQAEQRLRELGFLADGPAQRSKPAFLIATSAGEVGVDLDADHMVGDLVAWERMVQRFGRVNRRGHGSAELLVIDESESKPKKAVADALSKPESERSEKDRKTVAEHEQSVVRATALRRPYGEALRTEADGSFNVSPEALRQLSLRAQENDHVAALLVDASTTPPLRPALNRALVDAWAMTSLDEHTGRPEIQPWLRGWEKDPPQTTLAWRRYLPIRPPDRPASKKDIEEFFEAAPLHTSELLETETHLVINWLLERAAKLDGRARSDDEAGNEGASEQKSVTADGAAGESDSGADAVPTEHWKPHDVVAVLLSPASKYIDTLRLVDLQNAHANSKNSKELEDSLHGNTLIMASGFAGLRAGLLNKDSDKTPDTADDANVWIATESGTPIISFRIQNCTTVDAEPNDDWSQSLRFDLEWGTDGEAILWLSIQKWRDISNTEDDRAAGRPQLLDEHQEWTAKRARIIGERLNLSSEYTRMLALAARLHDEGKRAKVWQRAFHAQQDGIYAKTRGPISQSLLNGYRHEFGSLRYAENDPEFVLLPEELKDLVLHLIAAHHGFARPLIATKGCEDAPPSLLDERARDVVLRFARLHKRWGPWGLAWWEALLRAADAQASKANDERGHAPLKGRD